MGGKKSRISVCERAVLFVAASLFHEVEDMSKWLDEINENGGNETE